MPQSKRSISVILLLLSFQLLASVVAGLSAMSSSSQRVIKATIYSDLAWPWCYVAQKRLGIAVDSYKSQEDSVPIQIEWKPFMIDPGTKKEGEEYLAYNQRRWGSDSWTRSLRRDGQRIGANFADWQWWPNTLKAHQLVHYFTQRDEYNNNDNPNTSSNEDDITSRCNRALFEALYEEGANLSLVDTLVEQVAVSKLGLPNEEKEQLKQFLQNDQGASDVQREIQRGRQRYQISGVPFFVIGNNQPNQPPYGFSGAQPPETFLEIFEELSGNDDE